MTEKLKEPDNEEIILMPELHEQDEHNSRPVLTSMYLESTFHYNQPENKNAVRDAMHYCKKHYEPSGRCCSRFLNRRIPFINWIRDYDFKESLLNDIVGGITVGIIQIPQAMAFAQMAGLPPVNGLYVTFIHSIIYLFLGTSKHSSPGTFAVISLLTMTITNKFEGNLFPFENENQLVLNQTQLIESEFISNDPVEARVLISMVLSFSSGILLVMMGMLHLGFMSKYLSDAVVGGLSVGACYLVIMSQIKVLLGVKLNPLTIPFLFIGTGIETVKQVPETNRASLIISVISLTILFVFMIINEKFSSKWPVPIPIEVPLVIIATGVSYYFGFDEKWNVSIIGKIPMGFPFPRLPPIQLFMTLFADSVSIAVMTLAIQISFSKLFAKKNGYEISANQEFFAFGVCNLVASFFDGFPGGSTLARSFIAERLGVKSQLVAGISAIIVLVIILLVGPLLATLPNCVLASLIIVALFKKIPELFTVSSMFKKSKIDGMSWLITFLGVVIFDAIIGLYIGLFGTLFLIIFNTQRPRSSVLGKVPGTDFFESIKVCDEAKEFDQIKIIRYEESVYYANVDNFKYKILKLSGISPKEVLNRINKEYNSFKKQLDKTNSDQKKKAPSTDEYSDSVFGSNLILDAEKTIRTKHFDMIEVKHIILDLSSVNYVDAQGMNGIMWLFEEYKKINIAVHLSHVKASVEHQLKKFGIKSIIFFTTTSDAVLYIHQYSTQVVN